MPSPTATRGSDVARWLKLRPPDNPQLPQPVTNMEPGNRIEGPTMETEKVQLFRNALQAYNWRMKALSSNLANLDTPGYQRLSVSFEEKLQEVRHAIPGQRDVLDVRARMQVHEDVPIIEDELMNLADVQMRTQFSTRALHEHFDTIRMGITGRV